MHYLQAGADTLKMTQGEGGGDRNLWPSIFPELKEQIHQYRKPSQNGKPRACLKPDSYRIFTSKAEVNTLALSLADSLKDVPGDTHFGLDTENNLDETRDWTRVISLCFPERVYSKVIVLDLSQMNCFSKEEFPTALRQLLEHPKLIPVAVNISFDATRLEALGVRFERRVELMELGKQLQPGHKRGYGMQKMCDRILNLYVDKFGQNADWRQMKDSPELQQYAALDTYLHLLLHNKLTNLIAEGRRNGSLPIDNFTHGQKVKLTYRNKACAVGWLQFVGGTHGEMRKHGQTTIGKGKSLVMVQEVTVASVRPAFPFKATPEHPKQSYDHTKVTLRKAFDLHKTNEGALIAWPTERIQVQLESIVPHLETPQDHPLNTEEYTLLEPAEILPQQESQAGSYLDDPVLQVDGSGQGSISL